MRIPPILCVSGPSGGGKTRLLERAIPLLAGRGLRVGAVKHAGHVDAAAPGKDSERLAAAGAAPAVALGGRAFVAAGLSAEADVLDVVGAFCGGCDLVLAEGFRRTPFDKILVGSDDPAFAQPEGTRLIVADGREADFARDDAEGVADWIARWLDRRRARREGLIGAVLAGGRSRRMGTDKSRLVLGGRGVLARLYDLLADRLGEAWVIGRRPEADDLPRGARWHLDLQAGQGPLGGVATALAVAEGRGACVVGCDMPLLGGELLDVLLVGRDRAAPATAPVHPETGEPEPLAAVYEAAALGGIERALAEGRRGAREWLDGAGARRLEIPAALAGQLANVNTPEDLARLEGRSRRPDRPNNGDAPCRRRPPKSSD